MSREAGLRPGRVPLGAAGPRVTRRLCWLLTVPGSPRREASLAQPFETQTQGSRQDRHWGVVSASVVKDDHRQVSCQEVLQNI